MMFLNTLDSLLDHIKAVERETIELTKEAQLRTVRFIEKNNLTLDDETLETMQYQDIIAQQLSATIEAIESVQGDLQHFNRAFGEDDANTMQSIETMDQKLSATLERAKEKRAAFGGKLHHGDDGIDFF